MTVRREVSGEWREETIFKPVYPTEAVGYNLEAMPGVEVGDRLVLAISDGSEITAVAVAIETTIDLHGKRHQEVMFQFDPPLWPGP